MESYRLMGGVQVPLQRRLSRLYDDTKKSSDFVIEAPFQSTEAPEMKSLHRKLKIQKDRFVSWGLDWSDPKTPQQQQASSSSSTELIDESLSRAGLSEVVGSILSTIKDILAEAEPLWLSAKRATAPLGAPQPSGDKKVPLVTWDKVKFEDLLQDLTTSIDTLYDLSRTRSSAASLSFAQTRASKGSSATEQARAFESARMITPKQIHPRTLTSIRDGQGDLSLPVPSTERARDIVFMSRQAYAELTLHTGRQPQSPLLLEYAPFDPMYSATGIMPSMDRFEKLSTGLHTEPLRSPGSWTGLPRLLGYFEDMENSRLGLVYHFPPTFNPVSYEHLTQAPLYNLCSLSEVLARPDFEPKLEAKFRLALNLANTVFDLHARNIAHGNLADANVSFCNASGADQSLGTGEIDVRRPLISDFGLFPLSDAPASSYRHALDPTSSQAPGAINIDPRTFDLHSLAMLLLSIGLWTNIDNLVSPSNAAHPSETLLEHVAVRCGTLYMKAVQACWSAVEMELAAGDQASQVGARVQVRVSRYLEACCIMDSVGSLEDRLVMEIGAEPETVRSEPVVAEVRDVRREARSMQSTEFRNATGSAAVQPVSRNAPTSTRKRPKLHVFPYIALPAEASQLWNNVVMEQVNRALRGFYRRHAQETVEVTLKSVGTSAKEVKPTVLIVCTSVAEARSTLRRKLGSSFEESTGFALAVISGRMVRSRKQQDRRSMTHPGGSDQSEIIAANGGFQERPKNGASIGAWIGDRHLPPVSFGGLVVVDDRTYGMTVHHMLDDPDQPPHDDTPAGRGDSPVLRSTAGSGGGGVPDLAAWYAQQYPDEAPTSNNDDDDDDDGDASSVEAFAVDASDDESIAGFSESAITTDYGSDDGSYDKYDGQDAEAGDIPGIEPGCGDGYIITQPALDDIDDDFYANQNTQDEEHLDTCTLGEVYASSGIRRRRDDRGLIHEIDWALFKFQDDRVPDANSMPRDCLTMLGGGHGGGGDDKQARERQHMRPQSVIPAKDLPGKQVRCMARTSGLQSGLILPEMASIKVYGRTTQSHTYQVSSSGAKTHVSTSDMQSNLPVSRQAPSPQLLLPMGIPGDSGAWVVEREHGQVCGHVLAWSERNHVAYICPMSVLLADIAETLEAKEIRIPGSNSGEEAAAVEMALPTTTSPKKLTSRGSGSNRSSGIVTVARLTSVEEEGDWPAPDAAWVSDVDEADEAVPAPLQLGAQRDDKMNLPMW